MSNFNLDIYIEHEINKYLDTHIYPLLEKEFGLVFNRVTDMNLQHAGVDTVGKHKLFNKKLNIDEKQHHIILLIRLIIQVSLPLLWNFLILNITKKKLVGYLILNIVKQMLTYSAGVGATLKIKIGRP